MLESKQGIEVISGQNDAQKYLYRLEILLNAASAAASA
jgi:hypothetical protein